GFPLDADSLEAFDERGLDGGSGPGEWVEHGPTGRGDEADEPAHEVEGLDGGVGDAVDAGAFVGGGLGFVAEGGEEPGWLFCALPVELGGLGVVEEDVRRPAADMWVAPGSDRGDALTGAVDTLVVLP